MSESPCLESSSCRSLVVHYGERACTKLSQNSSTEGVTLNHVDEPQHYFEKVCISVPTCGKIWTLERVVGYEVEGFDDIVMTKVPSRIKCAELCIRERGMNCRSAEYHEKDQVCLMSRHDRRTQPLNFRPTSKDVHYLENQCADVSSDSQCDYEAKIDRDIGHGDVQITVQSQEEVSSLILFYDYH
ncbi:uncharacterized protein LOC143028103 [Oratosquilla oratoria]|uniref:uncharacterized protein LOC143028103 n=1 Tax=Oratosquilla oratoria TaxID=337810 RepID=UPI003F771868